MTPPSSSSNSTTRRLWIEGALVVAFWGMILMLNVGQRAIDPRGGTGITMPVLVITSLEYILWGCLTPAIFWLTRRISLERSDWLRPVLLHIGIAFVVAFVIDAVVHLAFDRLYPGQRPWRYHPLHQLLTLRFLDEWITYLVVLAAGFARDYFLRYREHLKESIQLEADKARLQAQLTEARLQALRMQLNPHFLFNTLHAIASLVERDPRGVRRMIARLSDLLRYTLEQTGAQEIPLHQELDLLRRYLDIQRVRFQGRLDVTEDIAPETADALVPNLILQPLVENAIKHGVSRIDRVGHIHLRAWREGDALHLSVSDNGPGIAGDGVPDLEQGVGLRNTRERLAGLYGEAYRLTFDTTGPEGLTVHVALPFHTAADLLTHAVTEPS
ncbi:sensor histidine kinase [Rhodothermaceae bacterium RA]|nr:sensor histidine kinase [Rhodothermaceae bacterium RA]